MSRRPTVLVDFDGVLAKYEGWKGLEVLGDPMDKARHAMYLLAKTHRIVCFTTRLADFVEPWLKRHGFPEMKVTNIKEPAEVIIDDRAICFQGVWDEALMTQIRDFTPWWKPANPAPLPSPSEDPVT